MWQVGTQALYRPYISKREERDEMHRTYMYIGNKALENRHKSADMHTDAYCHRTYKSLYNTKLLYTELREAKVYVVLQQMVP